MVNKLSLHLGKTEAILFGSNRNLKKTNDLNVVFNNEPVKSTKSVKYLGITLDDCLSGESVVNSIIKKKLVLDLSFYIDKFSFLI